MARLNTTKHDDEDLPELSTILAENLALSQKKDQSPFGSPNGSAKTTSTVLPEDKKGICKQRSLKIAHVNSLLLSLTGQRASSSEKRVQPDSHIRSSPRRAANQQQKQNSLFPAWNDASDSEDFSSDHMSDFIVSDSYCDSEEEHQSSTYRRPLRVPVKHPKTGRLTASTTDSCSSRAGKGVRLVENEGLLGECSFNTTESLIKKTQGIRSMHLGSTADTFLAEYGFEEPDSLLKFSPPRLKSPSRSPPVVQATTPSRSPSKSKLVSPTKRARIPPSPHRASVDAFWSQEVVNNWHDQHSPKKTPKSSHARKLFTLNEDDSAYLSPCEGRKSPSKSPVKPDKQEAERRKAFNDKKHEVAALFLEELDRTITDRQITKLAESTGGVRLVWSKKLQSTAGRANWRREAIRSKDIDGAVQTTRYRHHASIELAEKVIDDEDRLINVIAHEYCHLLNFMISNVKDNPHGKEFKTWARKCSAAFAHRGVNVTTKHTYEISYKYVWACSDCASEYKRHSKSVDPTRHSCGKCKGKLLQIKPVPRGEGKGISEYQQFVKEHFARVKKEKPQMSMGEVMGVLGREFREKKEKQKLVTLVIEEEVDTEKALEEEGKSVVDDAGLDFVAKKMDTLQL